MVWPNNDRVAWVRGLMRGALVWCLLSPEGRINTSSSGAWLIFDLRSVLIKINDKKQR